MAGAGRKSRKKLIVVAALAALVGWAIYDLYAPRTAHLREFDADEVARLETAMWRSYYEKQRLRLFNQLSELLRSQYNMPLIRSNRVAYYAADAAFVFKKGKQRSDYELALPALIKFYESIRKMSDIPFDVNRSTIIALLFLDFLVWQDANVYGCAGPRNCLEIKLVVCDFSQHKGHVFVIGNVS